MAADQLGGVGITLLRHDRRAGRELSESVTKPNSWLAQRMNSSASRDRCSAHCAAAEQIIEREVAVGDGVERVGRRPVEAERHRGRLAVDREAGAGQRRGTERAFVHPCPGVGEARAVARAASRNRPSDDGPRVTGCADWRWVKPGITVSACSSARPTSTRCSARISVASASSIASRTHSRKSVATWSLRERAVCSRPAAGADQLGKAMLDVHVDVLERGVLGDAVALIFVRDPVEALARSRRHPSEMMPWRAAS